MIVVVLLLVLVLLMMATVVRFVGAGGRYCTPFRRLVAVSIGSGVVWLSHLLQILDRTEALAIVGGSYHNGAGDFFADLRIERQKILENVYKF